MAQYCPLGTPSLLNGDFLENVARLKDFSWSIFFSSNPIKPEPSIGSEIVHFVEDHSLDFLIFASIISLYSAIYAWICHKCFSCMKIEISRNLVVSVITFGAVFCSSFAAFLVFHRQLPETVSLMAALVFFHIAIPYFIFQNKCTNLLPSASGYDKFRSVPLRIGFIIIVVLVFFFTPSLPREGDECPHKYDRFVSELYFWLTFGYIFMAYNTIHYMIYNQQSEVFYIWQKSGIKNHRQVIGQEKKKEGFGWIKDYYNPNEPFIATKE